MLSITAPAHAADSGFFNQLGQQMGQVWDDAKKMGNEAMEALKDTHSGSSAKESTVSGFQDVWDDFSEVANEAMELATRSDRNSRSTLEFLTAQEPKYVRLLKDAQDILCKSQAREQFDTIMDLQEQNRELQAESVELKRKRISAPAESRNPLVKTRGRIDTRLAEIPEIIAANTRTIDGLQAEIVRILNDSDVNITREELRYFLVAAEGPEILRLMHIADNMKRMQRIIEKELESDRNNVDLARIYTGMYLVSLDAYLAAHDTAMKNITGYRDTIKDISREAEENYREAQKLRKDASKNDKANLDANMSINERTIEVASMYDGLLVRRNRHLQTAREEIAKKVALARNTYKTISNGSTLISLVNSASKEYDLLVNFEMPELITIYDESMFNAFTEISEKIRLAK